VPAAAQGEGAVRAEQPTRTGALLDGQDDQLDRTRQADHGFVTI
jgi:hypothetical protein